MSKTRVRTMAGQDHYNQGQGQTQVKTRQDKKKTRKPHDNTTQKKITEDKARQ